MKKMLKSLMVAWVCICLVSGVVTGMFPLKADAASVPTVRYAAHVQDIGWMDAVAGGAVSGTVGQSKRLEAFIIELKDYKGKSMIKYRTKLKGENDWQEWKTSGEIAGTTGKGRALTAIQVSLTGSYAKKYDVYIRLHIANIGWLDWVKNGTVTGSNEFQVEAIEVKLVSKGMKVTTTDGYGTGFVELSPYEKAWWPMDALSITQLPYESFSHFSLNAVDAVGSNYVFAPFTGKVVYTSRSYGVTLFQSVAPVQYADGTVDYMTIELLHGSNYAQLLAWKEAGTVIPQGTDFYKVSGIGKNGAYTYADHAEIRVFRGLISTPSAGEVYAYDAFFLNTDKTVRIYEEGRLAAGNVLKDGGVTSWAGLWQRCTSLPSGVTELNATATVISKNAVNRSGPSQTYEVIQKPAKNTEVKIVGTITNSKGNVWYLLSSGEWIYSQHLKVIAVAQGVENNTNRIL